MDQTHTTPPIPTCIRRVIQYIKPPHSGSRWVYISSLHITHSLFTYYCRNYQHLFLMMKHFIKREITIKTHHFVSDDNMNENIEMRATLPE